MAENQINALELLGKLTDSIEQVVGKNYELMRMYKESEVKSKMKLYTTFANMEKDSLVSVYNSYLNDFFAENKTGLKKKLGKEDKESLEVKDIKLAYIEAKQKARKNLIENELQAWAEIYNLGELALGAVFGSISIPNLYELNDKEIKGNDYKISSKFNFGQGKALIDAEYAGFVEKMNRIMEQQEAQQPAAPAVKTYVPKGTETEWLNLRGGKKYRLAEPIRRSKWTKKGKSLTLNDLLGDATYGYTEGFFSKNFYVTVKPKKTKKARKIGNYAYYGKAKINIRDLEEWTPETIANSATNPFADNADESAERPRV